jgi:hypothetical protein
MGLLANPNRRERIGDAARDHVRRDFLLPRELADWATLIEDLLSGHAANTHSGLMSSQWVRSSATIAIVVISATMFIGAIYMPSIG